MEALTALLGPDISNPPCFCEREDGGGKEKVQIWERREGWRGGVVTCS